MSIDALEKMTSFAPLHWLRLSSSFLGRKNNNDNENDDGEDDTDYGFAILLFHRL